MGHSEVRAELPTYNCGKVQNPFVKHQARLSSRKALELCVSSGVKLFNYRGSNNAEPRVCNTRVKYSSVFRPLAQTVAATVYNCAGLRVFAEEIILIYDKYWVIVFLL